MTAGARPPRRKRRGPATHRHRPRRPGAGGDNRAREHPSGPPGPAAGEPRTQGSRDPHRERTGAGRRTRQGARRGGGTDATDNSKQTQPHAAGRAGRDPPARARRHRHAHGEPAAGPRTQQRPPDRPQAPAPPGSPGGRGASQKRQHRGRHRQPSPSNGGARGRHPSHGRPPHTTARRKGTGSGRAGTTQRSDPGRGPRAPPGPAEAADESGTKAGPRHGQPRPQHDTRKGREPPPRRTRDREDPRPAGTGSGKHRSTTETPPHAADERP